MTTPTPTPNPAAALLRLWRQRYPVLADNRPLQLGIHKLLQAEHPELSGVMIRRALFRHVSHPRYLAALATPGAQRHDLAGQPVEPVSDVHRHVAADKLAKVKAQRQAEQRQAAGKPPASPSKPPTAPSKPKPRAAGKPQAAPTPIRTGRATLSLRRTPA